MNPSGRFPQAHIFSPSRRPDLGALSPIDSFSSAWNETLHLLFRPVIKRRWIGLSIVCLFLGGGTSTAAFQWGFGALPIDLNTSEVLLRIRLVIAHHLSLIILAITLGVGITVGLIYVRCVLRFVLVDAVIKRDPAVGHTWRTLEPPGRSYFLWLMAVGGAVLTMASGMAIASIRYLSPAREPGLPVWLSSLLLVTALVAVIFVGLLVAILITLTDDFVVPLMYADRISLPAAWRIVGKVYRRDPGTFFFYLVLRFALSMGIGLAALIVLFPVLMGLSSGALVAASVVILALRVVGLAWTWNTVTIILGAIALLVFSLLLFALLSVVGMPGQVYLQNYGVRFIASRVPSLDALCRTSAAASRRR